LIVIKFINLPTWISLLTIVALPTLAFCGLSTWVCHSQSKGIYPFTTDIGRDIIGYFVPIVGLLLVFIMLSCWEDAKNAQLDLVDEAQKLISISRLIEQFSLANRQSVHSVLIEYIDLAIDKEWPTMIEGQTQPFTRPVVLKLYGILADMEATTPRQVEMYGKIVTILDRLVELRNRRLAPAAGTLPQAMWWAIVFISTLSMAALVFFPPDNADNYPALVAVLTLIFSVLIYVIIILQYPYSGEVRVEPALIRQARAIIIQEQ
jgi:cytochrome bd-type quinol oxidase subunit 2